jgi:hypothetical protein
VDIDAQRLAWGVEALRAILGRDPMQASVKAETTPGAHVKADRLMDWVKVSIHTHTYSYIYIYMCVCVVS